MKPFIQIFFALSLFLISCSGDCDLGYEGPDCLTEVRTKFIGLWTANDYECDLGNSTSVFAFEFSPGAVINTVEVTTPNTPDLTLTATVDGSTITIVPEEVVFGIAVTYGGQGTIVGNELNLIITRTTDSLVTTCTGTYIK